ncbi:MAG TPA: hypothetical protein VH372_02590 [Actinospica sp.]|nr:hypothetical protein [Actinospica sp.]
MVELGQAVCVGGEERLAERGEFEDFLEHAAGAGAGVVQGQPDVDPHVRVGVREVGGLAVVGVAVQHHDLRALLPDQAGERGEVHGVDPPKIQRAVAQSGVELQRQAVGRAAPRTGVQHVPQQHRAGHRH